MYIWDGHILSCILSMFHLFILSVCVNYIHWDQAYVVLRNLNPIRPWSRRLLINPPPHTHTHTHTNRYQIPLTIIISLDNNHIFCFKVTSVCEVHGAGSCQSTCGGEFPIDNGLCCDGSQCCLECSKSTNVLNTCPCDEICMKTVYNIFVH